MVVKTPVHGVISEDALKFSREQGIVAFVEKAVKTAREVFADAEHVFAALKQDPEFGDWYVDIIAVVPYDLDAEAQHHDTCLGQWVSFMPLDVLGKIRLSSDWAK